VKQAFADAGVPELAQPTVGPYSTAAADQLLSEKFDPETLASRGYRNEQLDQLVIDTILGA
jgi:xylose isomerase